MRSTRSPSSIERLLGLGPLPVPPHAFGCAPEGLAYAAFSRSGPALALEEYRTEALDDGTFQHGLLGGPPREPQSFAEEVRSFVAGIDRPVREATLVVPDAWLRTAFAEVGEIPANGTARQEVLRWKLKRLVPFRVDELRVRAVEVTPVAGQQEPRRLLLGFGVETLLGHLERAFASAGVHLGRITNQGLGALGALDGGPPSEPEELTGIVLAGEGGYTVVFRRGDEPILHRFKTFSRTMPEDARVASVRRDMRLTRTYLEEHWPDAELGKVVLAAPDDMSAAHWAEWLQAGLERQVVVPADGTGLRVQAPQSAAGHPPWPDLLPLAGAICQEVSS
ncbi:MAG: hypothetical protein ACLF0P_09785 [Thermoanaerobaculia bacterium]